MKVQIFLANFTMTARAETDVLFMHWMHTLVQINSNCLFYNNEMYKEQLHILPYICVAILRCCMPHHRDAGCMMTSSNGNIFRVTGHLCGEFTGIRSFDIFFDLRPNIRLSKQSWGWWFETPSRSLWRHCNAESVFDRCMCIDGNGLVAEWLSWSWW